MTSFLITVGHMKAVAEHRIARHSRKDDPSHGDAFFPSGLNISDNDSVRHDRKPMSGTAVKLIRPSASDPNAMATPDGRIICCHALVLN